MHLPLAMRAYSLSSVKFDLWSTIGIAVVLCVVVGGILGSRFIDPMSILIVLGGTIFATTIHFSPSDLKQAAVALKDVAKPAVEDSRARLYQLVGIATRMRREGRLALDKEARITYDPFLKRALELAVDNRDEHKIRRLLSDHAALMRSDQMRAAEVMEIAGGYAPAFGLVGTIVGLIMMLEKLRDPAAVGGALSLALLTTLYGAMIANLFCLPLAGKLRRRLHQEEQLRTMTIEAVVSLAQEENPVLLEERLESYRSAS